MIEYPIVDSHVHIADPTRFSYPWTQAAPSLNRTVLPEHLASAAAPFIVDRFVFVEVDVAAGQEVEEARWIESLAGASGPRLAGIVAALQLEKGRAVADDLARLKELPHLRGIRRLIQNQSDPDFSIQPDFLEGLKLLAEQDVSFDICVLHHQMPNVIEMVRRSPNVRFVLDHIGKPGIRDGLFDPWREHMRTLAGFDNVWCKISGVITEADHQSWTREEVRPYIAHAIDCFGFERSMYGGDWHVVELAGSYTGWVEIVDWVTAEASPEERQRLFRDNATAFYRLDG